MRPTRLVRSHSVLVLGMTTLLLAGCASKPPMAATPPANEETLRLVRQSMKSVDPNVEVGMVIAVLPDKMFAAVGDVDVKSFQEGEPITFIDSHKKFIANGTIKHMTADALDVQYEMPMATSPAPKVGDLAVRFKS